MFKIDLHTHSVGSVDGGLNEEDYRNVLLRGDLDVAAVTDHNSIDIALKLHKSLGDKIIVGEEVLTKQGEVVGLYLKESIPAGLTAAEVVENIHTQGGLVYIPHPFETIRNGCISKTDLDVIADQVDIVEIYNGRAILQSKIDQVRRWTIGHHKAGAASSDAHGLSGWGKTYTLISEMPTRKNLLQLLSGAEFQTNFIGLRGLLYPKSNRLKNKMKHD